MNLVKSTGTFGFYTVISRLLGYLRDVLIAIFLGTGFVADAFFVAFRIPNTFRRLFAEGTFNAAFVPSYTSELVRKNSKSHKFANEIFNLLFCGLLFLVIIIEIFMPSFVGLIAPGFSENTKKIELAIELTRITFPFLMFVSLSSFFSAILNSHNKFAAASAAPIILNLILVGTLFFGKFLNDNLVYYLSYGVSLAGLLQLFFLYKFVKRFYSIKFSFKFRLNQKVKIFFKKLLPSIFSSGVTQINILIGTIIASYQASAVSYLYYADRIYQINLAIAGIAVGTVSLPILSQAFKEKNLKKISNIQSKSIKLCLLLSIPASLGLIIGSEEIVNALFGYGSFTIEDVNMTAKALEFFGYGIPAFALIKILSNFFFARNNTKTPFYISLLIVVLNISISLIFFKKIGFIIIPIATSLSTWVGVFLYAILLISKKFLHLDKSLFNNIFKIVLMSILMSFILIFALNIFEHFLDFSSKFKAVYLMLIVCFVASFYLISCYLIGLLKTKSFKII